MFPVLSFKASIISEGGGIHDRQCLGCPLCDFFSAGEVSPRTRAGAIEHLALKKIAPVACRPVIFVRQLLTNCLPRSN